MNDSRPLSSQHISGLCSLFIPPKTPENLFREYKMGTLTKNGFLSSLNI